MFDDDVLGHFEVDFVDEAGDVHKDLQLDIVTFEFGPQSLVDRFEETWVDNW